ncbi:hypothetical protein ACFWIJ_38970 [Streptomyces sp. NPDC127079]|uniref:hypothetical protein n=1 Tax=Streptomyces sp. NPDC127079 TaxID=3347132 RepID=UPI00365F5F75
MVNEAQKETPLSADQIREIAERLGDIAQRVQAVAAEKKSPLYGAIGITISYEKAGRTATVNEALIRLPLQRVSEGRVGH